MKSLISVDNLIKEAQSKGINFGKGNPYNRLRYYTKMGWLPHMIRKKEDNSDNIVGHYPVSVLNRIITIEKLKNDGYSNEEITKKLSNKDKVQSLTSLITNPEIKSKIVAYTTLLVLLLIFANELEIINLGRAKSKLLIQNTEALPMQILDSGTGVIPANQKSAHIQSSHVETFTKVYITFINDYSPATRFWVSESKPQEGFTVELDAPAFSNANFSWWVSN